MRLSETLRKELYLERLREKLIKLYSYGDAEPDARKRLGDQIDGYFEAALLMKMIDSKVLQNIINEEHFKAFGMTREERKSLCNYPTRNGWLCPIILCGKATIR